MLNKIATQQLLKAGWYPGRNVDISDQIEFWESLGYKSFDAAIKFMEEFGKLQIIEKFISDFDHEICVRKHTTYVTEILEFYNEFDEQDKFEFNQMGMCKEKILPVVKFDEELVIFIGESGAFYCDAGLILLPQLNLAKMQNTILGKLRKIRIKTFLYHQKWQGLIGTSINVHSKEKVCSLKFKHIKEQTFLYLLIISLL